MAVTVGTDVFDSLANVDSYWSDRGNTDWAALSDANKETFMRKATDWISRTFTFRGTRATSAQRLHWPAVNAYDPDGFAVGVSEAPWQVKEAMAIVADLYRSGSYNLDKVTTSNDARVREKVDVIEVEYDPSFRLRGSDVPSHVYELLRPVTKQGGLSRA